MPAFHVEVNRRDRFLYGLCFYRDCICAVYKLGLRPSTYSHYGLYPECFSAYSRGHHIMTNRRYRILLALSDQFLVYCLLLWCFILALKLCRRVADSILYTTSFIAQYYELAIWCQENTHRFRCLFMVYVLSLRGGQE